MADGSTKSRSVGTNTDNDGGHKETQLDPIKTAWQIHRGPPSYTHAVLPWVFEYKLDQALLQATVGGANANWETWDFGFRMTSIYDPYIATIPVDENSGAGVRLQSRLASEVGDSRTAPGLGVGFLSYYATMYKYYSVLGCRYKVTIENLSNEKMFAYKMFCNDTNPPAEASNWDMMLWTAVEDKALLHPHIRYTTNTANGETQMREAAGGMLIDDDAPGLEDTNWGGVGYVNMTGSKFATFAGEYRPGQHQHEIHQDTDVEIWTPVNQNPKLREALLIRLKPYDNATENAPSGSNAFGSKLSFNIHVECEYLVEFKELQPYIRWPVNRNPISVNINTDARNFP